ncbi:MAG: hypothetical protein F6K04_21985, partial [Leptolyngbya sp. SIO4C5]|nr:hypothetical protein [Leptolyngbya sp. SIO4C5]
MTSINSSEQQTAVNGQATARPLNPEAQAKIKTLIHQLRAAFHKQQLSPEVECELATLAQESRIAKQPGIFLELLI